ncbi:nephrocystin-4 [Aplochiton taeniatus]
MSVAVSCFYGNDSGSVSTDSSLLTTVEGGHLDCQVKTHPALAPIMHLFPENMLLSGDEDVPGLVTSPTGDSMLQPEVLKTIPCCLDRLTLSLQPSLETFEKQLLQLVNADSLNMRQPGSEATLRPVVIQERRLHVGVHNGWGFLERPQVVGLEPQAETGPGRGQGSAVAKDSSSSLSQTLALRSSLELKLANHGAFGIVFQLEYVFSAPGDGTPHHHLHLNPGGDRRRQRPGQVPVVYQLREEDSQSVSAQDQGEFSAGSYCLPPRISSGACGWRRSHLGKVGSASRQHQSLTLSQLAATSRYPTISHSSAALPWQQPFPSPLYPSPLASAHQLSHVVRFHPQINLQFVIRQCQCMMLFYLLIAFPAASSIAHLEADLQQEGAASQGDGATLQELPFAPVHAPIITLGLPPPSSSLTSTRVSLAHLSSAGFPPILDRTGQVAEVLDPTEPINFDPQREEADHLQGNLLVFQFLAFSRIPTASVHPDWPENIHFTFQFYRFPPITTQRLQLLTAGGSQQKADNPLPCVLTPINRDGTVSPGSPGLQLQFRVDDHFLRPGERRWFQRYLALGTMQVDVWDSQSLLLIGSTALELKYLLRQGRPGVQASHEVGVLTTDYVGEEDTVEVRGDLGQRRGARLTNVHTILKGRLHVRTGNIGCPVERSPSRTEELPPSHSHIVAPHSHTAGFRGGSLSTKNTHTLNGRKAGRAQRLVEMDGELLALLSSRIKDGAPSAGDCSTDETDDIRQRKLQRMAAVRQREGTGSQEKAKVTARREERAQLSRDLRVISAYRERSKAEVITSMLSQAITTQHTLYAMLGTAEYFEFVLKNPFNVQHTVTIHSDHPDLGVIVDTDEWRYFKALTRSPTPLEENMFHLGEDTLTPQVYLRPKESVHIPFRYQTFVSEHSVPSQGPSFLPSGTGTRMARKHQSNMAPVKTIKVTFRAEDGKPLAVCQVNVEPTPHVVDQTFRLYHPESCFLKKSIRLPPWDGPAVGEPGSSARISVRCSDPDVICETKLLAAGEPQDVYLKVPGSPSPHVRMFFIMVFTDKWLAVPAQTWQIYVHFLHRVDLSCVTGQRTCQSLVLRGTQAIRKVKCYSSHPQEIQVDPAGVFVLPAGAVQDVQLKVQPWRSGGRFLFLSVVDVEQHALVTAWLVCLNVLRPVLSKAFEVCAPVGGGRGGTRRLTYTNPYTSSRVFVLRSDHPDLLQFKEDRFQVGGGESYSIGLRFAPSQRAGSQEILVYVNNLEEKTEETFCVKVKYS